jgi:hypothetical protein
MSSAFSSLKKFEIIKGNRAGTPEMRLFQLVCCVLLAAVVVTEFHLWKQFAKLNYFVLRIAISQWLNVVLKLGGGEARIPKDQNKKKALKTHFIASSETC